MDPKLQRLVGEIEENKQAERILFQLIYISWAAYLAVLISGVYYGDWALVSATLISIAFLAIPFWLLKRGYGFISGYILVVMVLGTVTLVATIGQGIHDVAIMAYPTIIIFASLALNRVGFRISVLLTLASMAWLVFGEASGLFVSKSYETPNWIDYLVIAAILLVAALAVNLLATNMRKNLDQAKQEIAQRKRLEELLRDQSSNDAMTGIYNRNFFEGELARLGLGREFPISIVIADIDGLKFVNDTQGHAVGDELLQQAAKVLRSAFRAGDILARIGGDEFAVLLPGTDTAMVEQIVSRVKEHLAEHNTKHADFSLQLSLGAATAEKSNLSETFTLADQRMYAEKAARKARRNQSPAS